MLEAGPGDLLQHGPRSYKLQLWVGGTIHLMCGWHGRQRARLWPVEYAVYDEIERGGGLSADDFHVAVAEEGREPPRRPLRRMAVFKASGTEINLLENQQWRLHQLQNRIWGGIEKSHIWIVLLRTSGLVRQRWQGSPESNWTQSAEGSESDEILRKCLTQKGKRGSHRVHAGL